MTTVADILETMEYGPAPEAAGPALAWIAERDGRLPLFIDGQFLPPASGEYFDSINPATGERLASIAQCGANDVNAAVEAARRAQPGWWSIGGHARARYLYAIARHIQKRSRLL